MIHLNFQNLELAFSEGRAPALSSRAIVGRVIQIGSEVEDQEETLVLVTKPSESLTPFLAVRCLHSPCLSAVGEVRWERESDDLITGVSMEGNQLIVSVDDHTTQTLDLIRA